ncbi:hypothetical protein LCGC14_1416800 [marine sediment metagenome]|uniref:Uncharacterized protein n=1 Tax=marine sediment metagenome TaxID=412755 RepID=A0A0F9JT10_9ZZZZ
MCLSTVFRGKKKKEALAKLKDTIIVWKILHAPRASRSYYVTEIKGVHVYAGKNKFRQNIIIKHFGRSNYRGGSHFWMKKNGHWDILWGNKLVRCTIKKSDINAIGTQNGHFVVVVKKAIFPKYIGKKKK